MQRENRRLAAIVAADIAGYSRLIEQDEEGTLRALRTHRAQLIDPLIEQHGGRIANTAGDSLLLEFSSAVDAVRCSVAVQKGMLERSAAIEVEKRICFRIGINVGDVIVQDGDLLGDGVNVAARLEGLAQPSGICISGNVHEQVRDRLDIPFEDLGEKKVKNIARRVLVWQWLPDATSAAIEKANEMPLPDKPSIAVLPFDYLGANKEENEYLADGLSENIIASLAHIPELLVIARNSTFTYKNKSVDTREVSEKFGVRYVLEGSVQQSGNQLRITAQLIDGVSGKHLWAETYDRLLEDIFAVQDEISVAIAQNIINKAVTGATLRSSDTNNLSAWKMYLKGREAQYLFTNASNIEARKYLNEALKLDPKYYVAMTLLAFSHIMDVRLGYTKTPIDSLQAADNLLKKALAESSDKAEAYRTMAVLRLVQKKKSDALRYSELAYDSAPGDATYASARGWILVNAGKPREAKRSFTEAKRLQPVHEFWVLADEYRAYIDTESYEEIIGEISDKLLAVTMEYWLPVILPVVALAYHETGDQKTAKELMDRAYALKPDLSVQDMAAGDLAYIDDNIREERKIKFRKLGLPETPPSLQ